MTVNDVIYKSFDLSKLEKKPIDKQFIKLSEEVGELAVEILVDSGDNHPDKAGSDGISGECIDVILMGISIFVANGGTISEFNDLMLTKMEKWEKQIL